jgi:protein-tyrosine-phosphatase
MNDRSQRMKKTILFVCIGNSGRSQMAEAFYNRTSGKWKGASAGIKPDEEIHHMTIEVMREVGLDVCHKKPKQLTNKMLADANRVVVMDDRVLKQIPSKYLPKVENWGIPSLLGKPKAQVEQIRDEINRRVEQLSKK